MFGRAPEAAVRRYLPPVAGYVAIGVCALVLAFAFVLLATEHAGAVFVAIAVAGGVYGVWSGQVMLRTGGVYETTFGIECRRRLGIGFDRVAWGEIETFRAVRTRVFVITRHQTAVALVGVAQGARIRWDGGETLDLVSVLNDRLDVWRAAHGDSVVRPLQPSP